MIAAADPRVNAHPESVQAGKSDDPQEPDPDRGAEGLSLHPPPIDPRGRERPAMIGGQKSFQSKAPVGHPGKPAHDVVIEEQLPADTIITAISQETVLEFLGDLASRVTKGGRLVVNPATRETGVAGLFAGGDAVRGPDSIIQAIADGRFAAEEIARRHGVEPVPEPVLAKGVRTTDLMAKKARQVAPQTVPTLPVAARGGFAEVLGSFGPEAAAAEAARCLDCDEVCSLCVTVCPNRANLAYAMTPLTLSLPVLTVRSERLVAVGSKSFAVDQGVQIVNVADFCNDCGNCTTFCPTSGEPFKDKPRFWIDGEGFEEATGDVFRMDRSGGALVLEARLGGERHRLTCLDSVLEYRSETVVARLDRQSFRLLECEAVRSLQEGATLDLSPCGTLLALLEAESVLPPSHGQPPAAQPARATRP